MGTRVVVRHTPVADLAWRGRGRLHRAIRDGHRLYFVDGCHESDPLHAADLHVDFLIAPALTHPYLARRRRAGSSLYASRTRAHSHRALVATAG